MKKKRQTKLNTGKFLILYSLGYNDAKIAKHMQVKHSTITYLRHNILKLPEVAENITLNKDQEEILIGTLLGDSYIGYVHSGCKYPCLTFGHCKKQELYAMTKFNKLRIIMSSINEHQYIKESIIKGKKCNIQPVLYARSHNCKILEKYRKIFYPNNIKVIPVNFLTNTFTAQSLAYLYMDDGCKNGKGYNLNLQCFEKENLSEFVDFLKLKFDIDFIVKKDKTLYLRYKSIEKFENLIKQYITEDMKYKLQCHR